jgi:DNA-binding GntR family transcriptional regulator
MTVSQALGPPRRAQTKVAVAVDAVRQAILEGKIQTGDRLIVTELAAALSMSPTPVREALRILEAEGLVENKPHRGAAVADLSAIDPDTIYALRAPMEALTTRLAVPRLSENEVAELESLQREFRAAQEASDDERLTRANAQWHMRIYETCGSQYLVDLVRRLWMPFHWAGQWVDPQRDASVNEHELIMAAIRTRDAAAAARLMQEHIERVHESILASHRQATD